MKKTVMSLGLVIALSATSISFAQQNSTMSGTGSTTMVGKESKTAFDRLNKKGAAMVAAITPTSAKLSSADQALMMEVAKGGMMQLEVSRVAVQKASSEEVRQLAQAEVEEQTGLSAKLMEIAQAKGITLPSTPDAETQRMVTEMQGMTGMSFDRRYVTESGVKGHEKLDAVMGRVKSSASDSNLKAVANAAHPLVKAHLKVSREVMNKMSGNNTGSR
jgi:putative membrane protein